MTRVVALIVLALASIGCEADPQQPDPLTPAELLEVCEEKSDCVVANCDDELLNLDEHVAMQPAYPSPEWDAWDEQREYLGEAQRECLSMCSEPHDYEVVLDLGETTCLDDDGRAENEPYCAVELGLRRGARLATGQEPFDDCQVYRDGL
ncbi:MAG: hypothetical protein HC927_09315 [Deltaproteobacteria bacterium]|nr:hypothetical protein [Deltaproteobacteria bacterium]